MSSPSTRQGRPLSAAVPRDRATAPNGGLAAISGGRIAPKRRASSCSPVRRRSASRERDLVRVHLWARCQPPRGDNPVSRYRLSSTTIELDGYMNMFDGVFGPETHTGQLYQAAVAPALHRFLRERREATVIVHGACGSGKSFTTSSVIPVRRWAEPSFPAGTQDGIMIQAIREIYAAAGGSAGQPPFAVGLSMFEVYNNAVYDLLSERAEVKQFEVVRDGAAKLIDPHGRVVFCADRNGCLEALQSGTQHQTIAQTRTSIEYARGHVLTFFHLLPPPDAGATDGSTTAVNQHPSRSVRFGFVDVRGMERIGQRMPGLHPELMQTELKHINASVLAFYNVFAALSDSKREGAATLQHLPWRNSALTRALRRSIIDTHLIVVVTICLDSREEASTKSVLKFAADVFSLISRRIISRTALYQHAQSGRTDSGQAADHEPTASQTSSPAEAPATVVHVPRMPRVSIASVASAPSAGDVFGARRIHPEFGDLSHMFDDL